MAKKDYSIFFCSVFFVLGFSLIFSLLGVLLQNILSNVSQQVQTLLSRIAGAVIILFGLYLLQLIRIPFLETEHKLHAKKFSSRYLTSFVFGAAFAIGWTPCVGAVLGAILTLAISQPGSAFILLLSYTSGLGIPFLIVGLFTNQARNLISKSGKLVTYIQYVFGTILIILGIFVFVNQLSRIANIQFISDWLVSANFGISTFTTLNLGIAFIAGIVSFLSPCVLPLIPAFLAYLASIGVKNE